MKKPDRIIPEKDLAGHLLKVQKPGRYTGGEYGIVHRIDAVFRVGVCYPDLYELGMSNQAVQLLYRELNRLSGDIACERVFAPAPDFEAVLGQLSIPLYGLDEGTPVGDFDIMAFSLGYELTLTNLLTVLDRGGVPVLRKERSGEHPVVLIGGPGTTNPVPLGDFADAVFIGEWETVCNSLILDAAVLKKSGASRSDILERVGETPGMWIPGRDTPVHRQAGTDFSSTGTPGCVIPSIQTVQDHGVVEIMRGCPSGCRFCHAGMIYRPLREKPVRRIVEEVDYLVRTCGYREITLSSLSTADYSNIGSLIDILNGRYTSLGVSFSLPSLRINTFTLGLLEKVSRVRKSGLTFAVETPVPEWQRGVNKEAGMDRIVSIMDEAKSQGWNQAKLYFMIGLPCADEAEEGERIIDFCRDVRKKTGMKLSINVGTFVPKPHTPFQWSRQLTDDHAFESLLRIKRSLENRNTRVSFQSPFVSFLEGVLSRGDEKAGGLFHRAFLAGARLDSWEEYLNRDLWKEVIAREDWSVQEETCRERGQDEDLPWDTVISGVSKKYLRQEYEKAMKGELTGPCEADCSHLCGVCGGDVGVKKAPGALEDWSPEPEERAVEAERVLIRFSKSGKAAYLSHINIMTIFERSLQRAGLKVRFTEGFNPKPKIEFARPLSLGVESEGEYAALEVYGFPGGGEVRSLLNDALPEGLQVIEAAGMIPPTGRRMSLMKAYWGSKYRVRLLGDNAAEVLKGMIPEYMVITEEGDDYLDIIVEDGSGQGPSLVKFLALHLGEDGYLDAYRVKRLQQYASDTGSGKGYTGYEEVFIQP